MASGRPPLQENEKFIVSWTDATAEEGLIFQCSNAGPRYTQGPGVECGTVKTSFSSDFLGMDYDTR